MGGCNHYEGSICIVCNIHCNTCCYDDKSCDKCNNDICRECYDKRNGICPVCTFEIVPDNDLVVFLLKKCRLTYSQAVNSYVRMKKRSEKEPIKDVDNKGC